MNMNLEWFKTVETDAPYAYWLNHVVFRDDFFDPDAFDASSTLYQCELRSSLLEDVVHVGVPSSGFTEAQLSDAIRHSSLACFGHDATRWFHVNVHDGVARVVERFGRYSYDYPLVPIYILLNYHQAVQGGTTFAGLASTHREWLLLFEDGLDISVHGNQEFVDSVTTALSPSTDA